MRAASETTLGGGDNMLALCISASVEWLPPLDPFLLFSAFILITIRPGVYDFHKQFFRNGFGKFSIVFIIIVLTVPQRLQTF